MDVSETLGKRSRERRVHPVDQYVATIAGDVDSQLPKLIQIYLRSNCYSTSFAKTDRLAKT